MQRFGLRCCIVLSALSLAARGVAADKLFVSSFAFSGSITPIQSDIAAAKISIEIDTDSLYADNPKLTQHLKSPGFFEVKKYPKATFVSSDSRLWNCTLTGSSIVRHGRIATYCQPWRKGFAARGWRVSWVR